MKGTNPRAEIFSLPTTRAKNVHTIEGRNPETLKTKETVTGLNPLNPAHHHLFLC